MKKRKNKTSKHRPAGYLYLSNLYNISAIPNWHRSFVAHTNTSRTDLNNRIVQQIFPARYWPGDTPGEHLEFALKYDGTSLSILSALFPLMEMKDILDFIKSRPTGKYARRIWYLYELLTGNRLPLEDLRQGNYVDLLDPEEYYTVPPHGRVKRQRINDNLPGNADFCPLVRRSAKLRDFEDAGFPDQCRQLLRKYSSRTISRAMYSIFRHETRSSYEIQRAEMDSTRSERFAELLQLAEDQDFMDKENLIDLQNLAVDLRFHETDYRDSPSYVGEIVRRKMESILYVPPRPEDLEDLMDGLFRCHKKMKESMIFPVVHAAMISWAFLFLRPFEDGNGRIHRFLLHNILAMKNFTPRGVLFPLSAAMLRTPELYDESLKSFSISVMPHVEYNLDKEGNMTVKNDTVSLYRYMDLTRQTELLCDFIRQTLEIDFPEELEFLAGYEKTKKSLAEIVDMPDRMMDLFIRFTRQNNGRLSPRKRTHYFSLLSDKDIEEMKAVTTEKY